MSSSEEAWSCPPLQELESLLRCSICKEHYSNAVILPQCSHNFCSLCIRRFLNIRKQCPICLKPLKESELKCNRILDQLVQTFTRNRQEFKEHLSKKPNTRSSEDGQSEHPIVHSVPPPPAISQLQDFDDIESQDLLAFEMDEQPQDSSLSGPTTVTTSNKTTMRKDHEQNNHITNTRNASVNLEKAKAAPSHKAVVKSEPGVEGSSNTLPPTGKAICPVCEKQISAAFINSHLDSCLLRSSSSKAHSSTEPTNIPHAMFSTQRSSKDQKPFKKLPKFVCSAMKDKELRTRLRSYGLSTQGNRATLAKRLDEFVLQYNSQCDSVNPKSMKEVASEVEKAEKNKAAASRRNSITTPPVRKNSVDPSEIERQNKAHVKKHADQYAALVAQARESRSKKAAVKKESPSLNDTITSDQTTPPISPVFPSRQPKPSPSFNTTLSTPTNRKLGFDKATPINRKLSQATPTNRKSPPSTSVSRQSVDEVSFDDLSPIYDGFDSDLSTPDLKEQDVFVVESPESNGVMEPNTGMMSVPESPAVIGRSRSFSKRKHSSSKTPQEEDLVDFDLTLPANRKKPRRT